MPSAEWKSFFCSLTPGLRPGLHLFPAGLVRRDDKVVVKVHRTHRRSNLRAHSPKIDRSGERPRVLPSHASGRDALEFAPELQYIRRARGSGWTIFQSRLGSVQLSFDRGLLFKSLAVLCA